MNLIEKIHGSDPQTAHRDEMQAIAPIYDRLVGFLTLGRAGTVRRATLDLADMQPGEQVLDVGCGTGDLAFAVTGAGRVVGLDASPAMIAQAQRKAEQKGSDIVFEVGSIAELPYAAESFDVVLSSLMIHHLTDAEKEAGFAEVYRVLAENGRFLIVDLDPTRRGLATRLHTALGMETAVDFVRDLLPDQLRQVGFTDVTTGKLPFKQMSFALAGK